MLGVSESAKIDDVQYSCCGIDVGTFIDQLLP